MYGEVSKNEILCCFVSVSLLFGSRLICWACENQDGRGDVGDADVEPPSRGAREAQEDIGEVQHDDDDDTAS